MSILARILSIALIVIAATGCAVSQPAPVQQAGPTITLAGDAGVREQINRAQAVLETGTAIAELRIATDVARTQQVINIQNAIAAQTQVASYATQTAQYADAGATQYAISNNATATAAALALRDRALEITQTAIASEMDAGEAAARAAEARRASITAEQARRAAEQADIDRQTDYIFKLTFGVVFVVFFALLFAAALRWLTALIAVDIRRRLIIRELGLQYDNYNGEWVMLPGQQPAPLPAPEPEPKPDNREIKINGRVYTRQELGDNAAHRQEHAQRQAWRDAARRFLRWSEVTGEDGQPVGFSSRPFMAASGVSDPAYRQMIEFLSGLGLLVKAGERKPWELRRGDDGERLTVSEAIRDNCWLASFALPSPEPPDVAESPKPQPHRTAPHAPHRNATQQRSAEAPPTVIEQDEHGKKTFRPWSEINPAPMTYEQLLAHKGIEE